ncbi:MAG TPA: hypothetical protein PLY34_21090 [Ferruginibacter sp.]|nr:hypothetical protein [Ferruginibacter sp.]
MKHDIKNDCTEKLIALSGYISGPDKDEAENVTGYSRPTIDRYLKGDGPKINVAFDLLNYFSKVLETRKKDLKRAESIAA